MRDERGDEPEEEGDGGLVEVGDVIAGDGEGGGDICEEDDEEDEGLYGEGLFRHGIIIMNPS